MARTTPAGMTCPTGTTVVQTTPPGRSAPPGTASTTSAWRSSGPWGTRCTTSCPRTTRTSPEGIWSHCTFPPGRTCSRWGRSSGQSSLYPGNKRVTGTGSRRTTLAGTCSRMGKQSDCTRLGRSRSPPGKVSETMLRCMLILGSKILQGRSTAHATSSRGQGSSGRNRNNWLRQRRGRQQREETE